MWLLLTVTVTCMCASPRCRSNAVSLSFNAYCQKLCAWGRGGNLCHCNAAHFVGKRRDGRQQELGEGRQRQQPTGQHLASDDDNELWTNNYGNDYDALSVPRDWNSTSADDVWAEGNDDHGSSMMSAADSRRRRQPVIFLALQRPSRRRRGAEDVIQLLRDSAKKGKRHERLDVDQAGGRSTGDDRRRLVTLNALTRRPMTFVLSPKTKQWHVLRKTTSQSREFP